jgi:hypothetical protein
MNSKLSVGGATTLGSTLAVSGASTFYGTLHAANWVTGVIPPSAISGGVGSSNFITDVSMNAKLYVNLDVSMNSKLSVGGDVSMNSRLYIAGPIRQW